MPKSDTRRARQPRVAGELLRITPNAAGIDVGGASHYVAVPEDRDPQPVREFAAFTVDLYRMADWLKACGIETVAMESTGVYWIPVFQVLEERGFEVKLVDARQLKRVPGRKTDVADCQWLQQLHSFGLLAGASAPTIRCACCAVTCASDRCWSNMRPSTCSICRRPWSR